MFNKKVLITGSKGQLGQDLVSVLKEIGYNVYGCSREELDITEFDKTNQIIKNICPDIIIHSAAYTKVDLAEKEIDQAFQINAYGTRNVAVAAESIGAKFVYVSTDYVFDGKSIVPYHEFDNTNPINIYGKSKLAGEEFVRNLHSRHFIVRTSWVYGKNGANFVKTMLELASNHKELNVVSDQIGSPTYTVDLAKFLSQLMVTDLYGTYHATNTGYCSWYEFAKAIFEEVGVEIQVNPIITDKYPRPASRPSYSILDHMSIRLNGFEDLPHWRDALHRFIKDNKKQ